MPDWAVRKPSTVLQKTTALCNPASILHSLSPILKSKMQPGTLWRKFGGKKNLNSFKSRIEVAKQCYNMPATKDTSYVAEESQVAREKTYLQINLVCLWLKISKCLQH